MSCNRKLIISLVFSLSALLAGSIQAQDTRAAFFAVVTDATGGVIPNATVTLTHEGTGVETTRKTSASGDAAFDFMALGQYRVTIQAPGFKQYTQTGIELSAGENVRQTFVLEVGEVTERIEVTGQAPVLETVSSSQQQRFDRREVSNLPLNQRNFSDLLSIGKGVTRAGGSRSGFRFNGVGKTGTAVQVDGVQTNPNVAGRGTSQFQAANRVDLMSIEAMGEAKTIKGIAPAEFGNFLGGQIQVITRSGTNEFHGSAFHNFQAEELNAKNPFLVEEPPLTFNQFGGSIAGPIKKNKSFFMFAFEGYEERRGVQVDGDVPTQKLRDEMLAANPDFQLILEPFPLPNQPLSSPDADVGTFISSGSETRRDRHIDSKADFILRDNMQLALAYSRGRPNRGIPRIFLNGSNDRDWLNWQERGTASFTVSGATWTSETRFGYGLNDAFRIDNFFLERDPDNPDEQAAFGRRLPRISTNIGFGGPSAEAWEMIGREWTLSEKVALHRGSHSLKFGGEVVRSCCFRTNPENPDFEFASKEDLLANRPSEVTPTFGAGEFQGEMFTMALFLQDTWRVSNNLTLNLGLRNEFYTNFFARPKNGSSTYLFNLSSLDPANNFAAGPFRNPEEPFEDDLVNLGPRFGFAYRPMGSEKTVLRGGFGMFYQSHVLGNVWQNVSDRVVPFRVRFSADQVRELGLTFPLFNDDLRTIVQQQAEANPNLLNSEKALDPDIDNPYTMQFQFSIQRELTPDTVFETSFIGTRGVKFILNRAANQADRITGVKPNPDLNLNFYADNSQQLAYYAWQSSIRKRYSDNMTFEFNYTYGKSIATAGGGIGGNFQGDNGVRTQDFFNIEADRGPASGDISHLWTAKGVWDIPAPSGLGGVARQALHGWTVSGILRANTGQALDITESCAGVIACRVDFVGGDTTNEDYRDTLQFLNPAAFQQVPLGEASGIAIRPGNIGAGAVRGPGFVGVDLSVVKRFDITERQGIRVRADFLNAFNRVNFDGLSTNINSNRFGRVTSLATPARIIQLSLRYSF